jgi:WD40 repeat protein
VTDLFISYSRTDNQNLFVTRLVEALKNQGKDVWVDWEDIPHAVDFVEEFLTAIDEADTIVAILSPDYLVRPNCQKELNHAIQKNKRIIPIIYKEIDFEMLHEKVRNLNAIFFRENDSFDDALSRLIYTINTDIEYVRAHTRLLIRASEWERKGLNTSFVLRGVDLRAAEEWQASIATKEPKPTDLQTQYILASRQAATARQRATLGGVSVALVVTIVLAIAALLFAQQSEERRVLADSNAATAIHNEGVSRSIALAAQAQLELQGTSPEKAVNLGLAALQDYPYTPQAEQVLTQAMFLNRLRLYVDGYFDCSCNQLKNSIAWSPDGKNLVTAGSMDTIDNGETPAFDGLRWGGNTAQIWKLPERQPGIQLSGHRLSINSVDWSYDGERIVTASEDTTVRTWNAHTGEQLLVFRPSKAASIALWLPNSSQIVTVSDYIEIWNGLTGDVLASYPTPERFQGMALSPDGQKIVLLTVNTIEIRDIVSWATPLIIDVSNTTTGISWSPDGRFVATGGNEVRVWNAETGKPIWNGVEGEPTITISEGYDIRAAFSPDSLSLMTFGETDSVKIWDVRASQDLVTLCCYQPNSSVEASVDYATWSPDGLQIATMGSDGSLRVWNAVARGEIVSLNPGDVQFNANWSPKGKYLASSSTIWDMTTSEVLPNTDNFFGRPSWSPDETKFAVSVKTGGIDIWDIVNLRTLFHLPGSEVAWSPDGLYIITVENGLARVWNYSEGKEQISFSIDSNGLADLEWSPDSKYILTVTEDDTVVIWDAFTGAEKFTLIGHTSWIGAARWSPDGQLILTASDDGTAKVWDAKTGLEKLTLSGGQYLYAAAWSPNGTKIATAGAPGNLVVWDALTGSELFTTPVTNYFNSSVYGLDWSPDGKFLAAATEEGMIRVFRVWQTTNDLIAYAKECCVVRELTDEERRQFGL